MPAYNFQPRFAALVAAGLKPHTIRTTRRGAIPGAMAYLYTGQRTKSCTKIGESLIESVREIELMLGADGKPCAVVHYPECKWARRKIVGEALEALARADGFDSAAEMLEWFAQQYGLPFRGWLHQWATPINQAA